MAANFNVLTTTPTSVIGADGIVGPGYIVRFSTVPSGLIGDARFSAADLTPENVTATVTPLAANLEAVKAL